MSIFGKLLKTAVDVATLPVAAAADIVTLGGELTNRRNTYTGDNARRVVDDLEEVYDEIDSL